MCVRWLDRWLVGWLVHSFVRVCVTECVFVKRILHSRRDKRDTWWGPRLHVPDSRTGRCIDRYHLYRNRDPSLEITDNETSRGHLRRLDTLQDRRFKWSERATWNSTAHRITWVKRSGDCG